MKIFIFIIGLMFFLITLFGTTFTFWQELIVCGMSGFAMGWGFSE